MGSDRTYSSVHHHAISDDGRYVAWEESKTPTFAGPPKITTATVKDMVTGSAVDLGVDAIDGEVFAPYLSGDGRTAVFASNGRGLDPGVPTLRVTTYVASLDAAGGTRPAPPPVQNAPGTLPTLTGDLPVVGDWNGDATDTIGVFCRGTWLLRNVNVPGPIDRSVLWGAGDDIPAAGDWDGDGTFGLGVRRVGAWLQRETPVSGPIEREVSWGAAASVRR